jgi:hypothetical protein
VLPGGPASGPPAGGAYCFRLFNALRLTVGAFVGSTCIHGVSGSVRLIEKSQSLRARDAP